MLSSIQRTIAEQDLIRRGDRVLVAVSGGPDSTALLFGLARLADRLGIELRAATVDHGLRPEAAGEAAAVVQVCGGLRIPCEVLSVDLRQRRSHVSLQDAARRARAAALTEAARRLECQRVALGHTADDQAETVLFRIVRGTGLAGLSGIPYRREVFIRPLLDVRRAQVLRFLRRRAIAFVEDPSNQDPRFTRSRVRKDWLPFLARENPRIVEALLALAADSRSRRFDRRDARAGDGPGRAATVRIEQLARRAAGTKWISFRGGTAEVAYGRVTLGTARPAGRGPGPVSGRPMGSLAIPGPGVYRWPAADGDWLVEISLVRGRFRDGRPTGVGQFSKDCLAGGLSLRAWQPGDRMRPRGAPGARKLQDLFVDAKVPRTRRPQLPLLISADGTILYVPGLRPADRDRPRPDAQDWVEVRVTGPGAHLSCPKTDSASARVDDLSLDDNTFSLGDGYPPRTS